MKKLTLLLTLVLLAACSPKKTSVNANTTGTATIAGVSTMNCAMGSTSGSGVGTIYDQSQGGSYGGQFENQVKALLSATVSPYDVGSISASGNDSTGVRFKGAIKLDSNGAVVASQTRILISVYDSIWLQRKYTNPSEVEIQLEFDPAKKATISGQFNMQSGDGFLSLRDQYGEVRFEGRIDAQNFSGTLKFQNSTSVTGRTPASGVVGQFFITRCGILQ